MGRITLLATIVLVAACGKSEPPRIDAAAAPFVKSFYAAAAAAGRTVPQHTSVVFGDLSGVTDVAHDGRLLGFCTPAEGRVVLDGNYWETMDDAGREALVFHELGHCELGQEHREGYEVRERSDIIIKVRAPVSVMQSAFIGGDSWTQWREDYIEELFAH